MVRKRRRPSDAANNSVFLPMELIIEILSLLNVKAILRFKCVSKSWNTLTSDSTFVDKHLKASSRNPHLTLSWHKRNTVDSKLNVVPIPVHRLLKKPSATISSNDFHRLENPSRFVGSCNGLLCFLSSKPEEQPFKYLLHISNPATRTRSQIFEFIYGRDFHFTFGYDASTTTYKIVAFRIHTKENSEVKVFNLGGNNCWRNIQNFPIVPPNRLDLDGNFKCPIFNDGVHFYGTINWLALDKSITIVIVSLDLSTETYKQFLLPALGFDLVPISKPDLRVLMDCLCFSHDSNKTEFILWKMKEYGVQESWIQLFKISYQNLAMQLPIRLPAKLPMHNIDYALHYQLMCLYVNGDIVILASACCKQAFFYNLKDKTVVKITSKYTIYWFVESKHYVESLVSVH